MRTAIFLLLPTTLILSTNYCALAQLGVSVGPTLVLVKGDTSSNSTPRCSFVSALELEPVPIVNRLLTIQSGYSPDQVQSNMGFSPDQPYANNVLQWTAVKERNYANAVVNFRNNAALSRYFTMAINYQQPNQKECQWIIQQGLQTNQPNQTSQPFSAP